MKTHARFAATLRPIAAALCTGVAATAVVAAATTPAEAAQSRDSGNAPVVHRNVDVDGDGRADVTRLERIKAGRNETTFRISTRTAKKRSFSTTFTVPNYGQNPVVRDAYVGVAGIDGARGAEYVVDRSGGVGDFPSIYVYTVRNNRWVLAKAPEARNTRYPWQVANHPAKVAGYDFSTVKGQRRVVVTDLTNTDGTWDDPVYSGTRTTYRWNGARGWQKLSSAKLSKVSDAQAQKWSGLNGLIWR